MNEKYFKTFYTFCALTYHFSTILTGEHCAFGEFQKGKPIPGTILKPAPIGGKHIDEKFTQLIISSFGEELVNAFNEKYPWSWKLLCMRIENLKKVDDKSYCQLNLDDFGSWLERQDCDVQLKHGLEFIAGSTGRYSYLKIPKPAMAECFAVLTQSKFIKDICCKIDKSSSKLIFMVGGLAASKHLLMTLKGNAKAGKTFILPNPGDEYPMIGGYWFGQN